MIALEAEVQSIFRGTVRDIAAEGSGEWWDKAWRSGFRKEPQDKPCWLDTQGLHGDEQADRENHGGPDKAVCVYPGEHYTNWRAIDGLREVNAGAFGENFTSRGLLEDTVCVGDIFAVGETQVQVSQPRQPCWKLARRWRIKDLAAQVERTGRTGFYLRVLQPGLVSPGDRLILRTRAHPEWTIAQCNEVMHHRKHDAALAGALAACPALSASWRKSLTARAQHPDQVKSSAMRLDQP